MNVVYPTIRFTSPAANAEGFFAVTLGLLAATLWTAWILIARFSTRGKRIMMICIAVPLLATCLVAVSVGAIGIWVTDGESNTPLEQIPIDHGRVAAYQAGGGATELPRVTVRYERLVLPGVLYVHDFLDKYPVSFVTLRDVGHQYIEIDVPPSGRNPEKTLRVKM